MRIHDLVLPKIDEAQEDCEDRLAVARDDAAGIVRAAVADGATATAFAGEWAELLVQSYCERPFANYDDLEQRCASAAKQWTSSVYSEQRPWHALIRAQSGGAAAIAGIEILTRERRWSAIALGDSCIFQIRKNHIYFGLPPYTAGEFNNHPSLISTDASKNVGLDSAYECAAGYYRTGDQFVLATDAASEALLRADESVGGLGAWVRALRSNKDETQRFIRRLRESRAIRDDDIAIVMIEV